MPRIVLLALPLALAGCAASIPAASTEPARVDVETAEVAGGAINLQVNREAAITSQSVAASPEQVWRALPQVFAELDIPLAEVLTSSKMLTASGQRIRRIGGRGMASYFDCPGAFENLAASSDVYFTVRAQVLPGEEAEQSTLRTQLNASARSSSSGTRVLCTSRGSLEKLILLTLSTKLAAEG